MSRTLWGPRALCTLWSSPTDQVGTDLIAPGKMARSRVQGLGPHVLEHFGPPWRCVRCEVLPLIRWGQILMPHWMH